jgi:Cu2+-containing amine oxidase
MSRRRLTSFFSLGLGGTLVVLAAAPAQPVKLPGEPGEKVAVLKPPPEPIRVVPAVRQNEVVQTFPCTMEGKTDKMATAWKVKWATRPGNGLYITGAWFKKSPADAWMQVLGDARLAQAFVPYHRGQPRFWDVSYGFGLDALSKADGGPFCELLRATPTAKAPTVIKEIRDRGVMWKHPQKGVRRGQAMVLWASLNAANYRYLIEYGFQDDGTIAFRVGASGHNFHGSEWVTHMHNAMWRIDVNLDGPDNNSVELCENIESAEGNGRAESRHTVLKTECGVDWDPGKFTMLRVIHTEKKNKRGEPWSYDLMPMRMGNARHFGKEKEKGSGLLKEECTQHDFWVTRADPKEMTFHHLPKYVQQGRSIEDTDVVLWYTGSCLHVPRSEDGEMGPGGFNGATHVMWCGFDLRPRNIFDRSPFYPYP